MSLLKPSRELISKAMNMSISSWEDRLRTVEECIGLYVCTTHDWAYMIGPKLFHIGCESCPLCVLFHSYYPPMSGEFCDLCPIKLLAGEKDCRNTPYIKVLNTLLKYARENKIVDQELIDVVALQVEFLEKARDSWLEKYDTE